MKARVRRIGRTSKEYWEARYQGGGNSGDGSYGVNGQFKINVLNCYFDRVQPLGVVDFGVGDFIYSSVFEGRVFSFFGLDVSTGKIAQLQDRFEQYGNLHFASSLNVFDNLLFDHTLSLDVIFHLLEDSTYMKYISDITQPPVKRIIVYSSNFEDNKWELHVRHSRFVPDILSRGFKLIEYVPNPAYSTDSDFYYFERDSSKSESEVKEP